MKGISETHKSVAYLMRELAERAASDGISRDDFLILAGIGYDFWSGDVDDQQPNTAVDSCQITPL